MDIKEEGDEGKTHSSKICVPMQVSFQLVFYIFSRSSQCSTTGLTKAVVCAILSVGWCI